MAYVLLGSGVSVEVSRRYTYEAKNKTALRWNVFPNFECQFAWNNNAPKTLSKLPATVYMEGGETKWNEKLLSTSRSG